MQGVIIAVEVFLASLPTPIDCKCTATLTSVTRGILVEVALAASRAEVEDLPHVR